MEKMLELVINAYRKAIKARQIAWEDWTEAKNDGRSEETVETFKLIWRDSCEAYWCYHKLLEEYGFTLDQLYEMEQEEMR